MKFDLHIHSKNSKYSPKDVVKQAIKKGLDGIAITDYEIKGALIAKDYAKNRIIVIPGMEVKTNDGDILALGIKDNIEHGMSAVDTVDDIRKSSGISVAAHPYDLLGIGMGDLVKTIDIDAIEVLNGENLFRNRKAVRVAKENGISITGGSDAHTLREIGCAITVVDDEDVLEEILRGRSRVKGGVSLPPFWVLRIVRNRINKLKGSFYYDEI